MSDIYSNESDDPAPRRPATGDGGGLKDQAAQVGETVKQEAAHFAEAARETVEQKAQGGQQAAATALGGFADAIRKAGDELGRQDQTFAARLASQAAEGLEGLSRNLADKAPEDMLHAVRDFGRANPAAFMAGAVLAGVALGRFARASGRHEAAPGQGAAQDLAGDARSLSAEGARPAMEGYEISEGMDPVAADLGPDRLPFEEDEPPIEGAPTADALRGGPSRSEV